MPHDVSLIATIAAGFGLAMIFGLVAVSPTAHREAETAKAHRG